MRKETEALSAVAPLADTHCHVLPGDYGMELHEVMRRAAEAGVTRMLVAGSDLRTSREAIEIAIEYSSFGVYAAVGVHPHEAACFAGRLPDGMSELALHPRVVAVGETGLDYYYDHSPRDVQRACFREHIRQAGKIGKPLIIHGRDSYDDLRMILGEECRGTVKGVVHCFSGTEEDAADLLRMGLYLSFGGPLTFKKNDDLRELFRTIPEDRILLETDSPWLAPHPLRGRRNEPSYVRLVYDRAAEIRGVPPERLAAAIFRNAAQLFGWGGGTGGAER